MAMGTDVKEPEVVKAVTEEIKKLGENTKANYEELNRRHEELKSLFDSTEGKVNALIEEQLKKLATDVTVRQDTLDKHIDEAKTKQEELFKGVTSRIDEIEVAFKRSPNGAFGEASPMEKEAAEFYKTMLAVSSNGEGATHERFKKIKPDVNVYDAYKKSFEDFLRNKGGERALTPEQFKSLSVGIDPDGGYTVTPAMGDKIFKRLFEVDPMRALATIETISTGAIEWLVDWDEAGWGWEEETVAGSETTTPTFNKKRIPVHVLYAKPRASQVLLEDSGINITDWLAKKVADRFLRGESAAFVTGTGVGQPRGFTTYDDGTSYGQIERTNMGAAAALTADGFYDVKYSLIEQYLEKGTWLMARGTLAAALLLKDGMGNYLWSPNYSQDSHSVLLGLPVRMSTSMPAVAADALSVAIADWKEAYMIVDRLGITIQRDPYTVKPFVEFYTRKRVGGDVTNFQSIKLGVIAA